MSQNFELANDTLLFAFCHLLFSIWPDSDRKSSEKSDPDEEKKKIPDPQLLPSFFAFRFPCKRTVVDTNWSP